MSPSAPSEEREEQLFANPGANGSVASNFAALSSSEALARIIAFGGMLYVARRVGAANYGVIAFVSGLTLYLAKIADFGIDTIGTVEIAKRRGEISRFASAVIGMRFMLAVVVTLAAIASAQIWLPEPERTVLSVFALTILPVAASTRWIHLGLEGALPIGVWRVAGEVLTLALIVAFVRDATHLWRVPAAVLIGDSLMTGMLGWLLVRRGYGLRPRWDPKTSMPIFIQALPVVGQILLGLLIYNSSVVFLRVMRSIEAVGLYAAAYALISFLANICTLYGMSLLPALARLGRRSVEEQRLYQTALAQVFAVTLPVSVCGIAVADTVVRLVFGPGYSPSARVLRILMWVVLPYAMRVVPWAALIARGHQGLVLRATGYAVGANIVLNLVLIHSFGLIGAAISVVATESLVVGLTLYYAVRQGFQLTPRARFWRPVFAVLVMVAALWISREVHVAWQLAAAATAYALALVSVGGITFHRGIPALAV